MDGKLGVKHNSDDNDVSPLTRLHPLPEFDGHISFDEATHRYFVAGQEYQSCSGLISEFTGHFDAAATVAGMMASPKWPQSPYYGRTAEDIIAGWTAAGGEASSLGTAMHAIIERAIDGRLDDLDVACLALEDTNTKRPELGMFLQFQDGWLRPQGLVPWRVEARVFSVRYRVAGSIDGLFLNPRTGCLVIVDWKRSKDLNQSNRFRKYCRPPLQHLPDTKYSKYALQQNVYRWLLEHGHENGLTLTAVEPGHAAANNQQPQRPYRIEALCLAVLHPDNATYQVVTLPDLQREVQCMLTCRAERLAAAQPAGKTQ